MNPRVVACLAAIAMLHSATASAGVLFKEDFESAAVNAQLTTLGFTYPNFGTIARVKDVQAITGTGKAWDGRIGQGSGASGNQVAIRRPIPTASSGASRVEISIDAYMPGPNGNQSFELFGNGPPGDQRFADITYFNNGGFISSFFNASGVYQYSEPLLVNITGQVVNLKFVYDITTNRLWTEVNGTASDPFTHPDGTEARFTEIEIYNDQRGGVSDPGNGQGSIWDNLTVTEFTSQPGDFDGSGQVDGADFLIWQRNFSTMTGASPSTGDTNTDGDVDADDLGVWTTKFGGASVAVGTTVPEPSGALGAMILLGFSVRFRRSRRGAENC